MIPGFQLVIRESTSDTNSSTHLREGTFCVLGCFSTDVDWEVNVFSAIFDIKGQSALQLRNER